MTDISDDEAAEVLWASSEAARAATLAVRDELVNLLIPDPQLADCQHIAYAAHLAYQADEDVTERERRVTEAEVTLARLRTWIELQADPAAGPTRPFIARELSLVLGWPEPRRDPRAGPYWRPEQVVSLHGQREPLHPGD